MKIGLYERLILTRCVSQRENRRAAPLPPERCRKAASL